MGRASRTKRERRETGKDNPWATPLPAGGDPTGVHDHLEQLMGRLEQQRHAIHADDGQIKRAAEAHHDASNGHIRLLEADLQHDPTDQHLGAAHARHLAERRGAEEVHGVVGRRMAMFKPKI